MEGSKKEWEEFANREKLQAENFLKASEDAGVKRIIYLGRAGELKVWIYQSI